jgi:outer membrane protein assembly factor BamB
MSFAVRLAAIVVFLVSWTRSERLVGLAAAADWPVFGRDATRNAVVPHGDPPTDWDVTNGRNIKWKVQLGSQTIAAPVVAGGHVYIGTNNGAGYLERYPPTFDLGCLLCFRESDGQFLWQYSAEKLPIGRVHDWPVQGLVSSPLVEGNRLWFVSNRHVVVCLDTQGFRDQKNDGPYLDEPVKDSREADVVWQVDLIKQFGVHPHPPGMGPNTRCSIAASYGDRIYVVTGNGVDATNVGVPAPEAPSLICMDKNNGHVLWSDASPGKNILDCQCSNPLVVSIAGRTQVIVPQGDGWIRSFDASTGKLVWKFDINKKTTFWRIGGGTTRNYVLATPVIYKGKIYVASGRQVEWAPGGSGRLVCIDPTKTGDISSELAVDRDGKLLPHRRERAVDQTKGENAVPNPNSGLLWEFTQIKGSTAYEDMMHRTLSTVAIHDGLVIAPDFAGIIHCLDADTGQRYWSFDAFSAIWASPLIVEKTIYAGDEDGNLLVFRLSKDPDVAMKKVGAEHQPIARINMGAKQKPVFSPIYSSPVFANDVLYVATRTELFAIAAPSNPARQSGAPNKNSGTSLRRGGSRDASIRAPKSIFAPTPQDVVETMLELAHVSKTDTVVDLGSGDGRIVITAARRHGAKGIGYEIDTELVARSRSRAEQEGVAGLVDIRQQDLYSADLIDARVVAVFLYPAVLEKLKSQFAKMKYGTKIVSHHYAIPDAKPDRVVTVKSKETGDEHRVLLYILPLSPDDSAG